MESLYVTCTIGPNFYMDFSYDPSFGRYGPPWVPALFFLLTIEGLGFEPRTLGFEAQVATTLATEARLVHRSVTLFLCLLYSQGFALAYIARSLLAFCSTQKPHFGASTFLLPRALSFALVAREPKIFPYFSPLSLGAIV